MTTGRGAYFDAFSPHRSRLVFDLPFRLIPDLALVVSQERRNFFHPVVKPGWPDIALYHGNWKAAFLAGKYFMAYRRQGGEKSSTLPDFFIGAHAAVARMPLLTRDVSRYRTYFPKLE